MRTGARADRVLKSPRAEPLASLRRHLPTRMMAATFVFYQDRYRWWIEMRQTLLASAEAERRGLNRKA